MMKNKVKRLTLALIAVGLSSPVLASSMDVSVPCQSGGVIVGATGLYMMPSSDGTSYGASYSSIFGSGVSAVGNNTFVTGNHNDGTSLGNDPSYGWGYGVQLGYAFPNTGNDIMAKYSHLSTASTETSTVPGTLSTFSLPNTIGTFTTVNQIVPSFADAAPGDGIFTQGIGRNSYGLDTIDLSVGQHISIGSNFDLRLYSGVAWAQVENTNSAAFAGTNIPTTTSSTGVVTSFPLTHSIGGQVVNSKFNGIGPEIGFDGRYCINQSGFGFDSHLGAQLLVGDVSTSEEDNAVTGFTNAATSVTPATTFITGSFNQISGSQDRRVVPELDASLALDYKYAFPNQSVLTTTLGYQVINYFNVTREVFADGSQAGQNVAFQGPFLTVKYAV